jgi:carboxyl-terminal processing protease
LEDTQGQFAGLGVEVDFQDDVVTVVSTMPNSPAERAGIRPGDRIVAVDGTPITGVRADSIVRRMRGPVGTLVRLTIRRKGQTDPLTVSITRAIVTVSSVEGRLLDDQIAYVRLKVFQEGCYLELLEQLVKLGQTSRIRGLILDLRSNPGGLVSEAVAIADEFLDRGVIYSARHRGHVVEVIDSNNGDLLEKLPMLVLVNAATASSAEIVAGALQDRGRATILGEPTFGKGSVQSIIELDGGAGLLLTTLRYFTPNGRAIQARGLSPDVRVANESGLDNVREADIAGHLPTEGLISTEPKIPETSPVSSDTTAASSPSTAIEHSENRKQRPVPPERTPIETVETNPLRGSDVALAKGFELLRNKLVQ